MKDWKLGIKNGFLQQWFVRAQTTVLGQGKFAKNLKYSEVIHQTAQTSRYVPVDVSFLDDFHPHIINWQESG